MKVCEICGGKHYAKLRCKAHYRMPSRTPKVGEVYGDMRVVSVKPTPAKGEKTIKELLKLLEIVFNRWIRKRDTLSHSTFICISCGHRKMTGEMDAGHFFSKTFSALRFNEDNVHSECKRCNQYDDQHLKGYEVRLKEKIGLERFNLLLENYNKPHKWDRQELLDLIQKYK